MSKNKYIKKSKLITVLAPELSKDEIFWLGYRCKKCGLRFHTSNEMSTHQKIHKPNLVFRDRFYYFKGKLMISKTPIKQGFCQICGDICQTQLHHLKYDYDNTAAYTLELCPKCHGKWHAEHTPNWGRHTP